MHAIKPSFARSFGNHLALGVAITALLISKWCSAAEPSSPKPRCSIVYINGDAVIRCPAFPVTKGAR